jgi:putative ABC transport system substrate-binding protein
MSPLPLRPHRLVALAAGLTLLAGCDSGATGGGTATVPAGTGTLTIGVLQIAAATVLDDTVAAFEQELRAKLAPRQVTFQLKNAQGDSSLVTSIARDLAGSRDDAFAVIGTPAVLALSRVVRDRPIFAIAMGDPVGAKVAASLDAPGGNVTGSVDFIDPTLLLDQLLMISPQPRRLGTLYDPSNQNMQTWVAALKAALAAHPQLRLAEATISGAGDVPTAARSLVGRADALLVGPDATVFTGLPALGAVGSAAKIPVYLIGGDVSTAGVFASLGPDYPTVGRLAATAAAAVLAGGKPAGQVPFGRPTGVTWQINKATLAALRLTVPAAVRASAGLN